MSRVDGSRVVRQPTPGASDAGTAKADPSPPSAPATTRWAAKAPTSPPQTGAPARTDAQKDIVCPVLGALVAEGRVKLAPDGTVNLKDLDRALADLGLTRSYQLVTHPVGWGANALTDLAGNIVGDTFNVEELRSGMIKHPGDSAVLSGGTFDQAKFAHLTSFAEDGVMTESSFAKAIASNVQRDARVGQLADTLVRGKSFSEVEFGALLGAFGTKDPKTGKVGISVEDLRALYQDKKVPPGRSGAGTVVNAAALTASLGLKVDAQLAGKALGSLATATGLARHGAALAEGKADAEGSTQQAAMSAGKAAACPYMNGALKMPATPAGVVNAHTSPGNS